MPTPALRPARDRWCDTEGTHIALFWVEQVTDSAEPGVLPSRPHQPGQVVGRGRTSLYVRFFESNQLASLAPHLLRLLPDTPDQC